MTGRKERNGLFPASVCVKLKGEFSTKIDFFLKKKPTVLREFTYCSRLNGHHSGPHLLPRLQLPHHGHGNCKVENPPINAIFPI